MSDEQPRPPIRQVSHACPQCGSYYRRGAECNICGTPQSSREILREEIIERRVKRTFGKHGKYHRMEKIGRY